MPCLCCAVDPDGALLLRRRPHYGKLWRWAREHDVDSQHSGLEFFPELLEILSAGIGEIVAEVPESGTAPNFTSGGSSGSTCSSTRCSNGSSANSIQEHSHGDFAVTSRQSDARTDLRGSKTDTCQDAALNVVVLDSKVRGVSDRPSQVGWTREYALEQLSKELSAAREQPGQVLCLPNGLYPPSRGTALQRLRERKTLISVSRESTPGPEEAEEKTVVEGESVVPEEPEVFNAADATEPENNTYDERVGRLREISELWNSMSESLQGCEFWLAQFRGPLEHISAAELRMLVNGPIELANEDEHLALSNSVDSCFRVARQMHTGWACRALRSAISCITGRWSRHVEHQLSLLEMKLEELCPKDSELWAVQADLDELDLRNTRCYVNLKDRLDSGFGTIREHHAAKASSAKEVEKEDDVALGSTALAAVPEGKASAPETWSSKQSRKKGKKKVDIQSRKKSVSTIAIEEALLQRGNSNRLRRGSSIGFQVEKKDMVQKRARFQPAGEGSKTVEEESEGTGTESKWFQQLSPAAKSRWLMINFRKNRTVMDNWIDQPASYVLKLEERRLKMDRQQHVLHEDLARLKEALTHEVSDVMRELRTRLASIRNDIKERELERQDLREKFATKKIVQAMRELKCARAEWKAQFLRSRMLRKQVNKEFSKALQEWQSNPSRAEKLSERYDANGQINSSSVLLNERKPLHTKWEVMIAQQIQYKEILKEELAKTEREHTFLSTPVLAIQKIYEAMLQASGGLPELVEHVAAVTQSNIRSLNAIMGGWKETSPPIMPFCETLAGVLASLEQMVTREYKLVCEHGVMTRLKHALATLQSWHDQVASLHSSQPSQNDDDHQLLSDGVTSSELHGSDRRDKFDYDLLRTAMQKPASHVSMSAAEASAFPVLGDSLAEMVRSWLWLQEQRVLLQRETDDLIEQIHITRKDHFEKEKRRMLEIMCNADDWKEKHSELKLARQKEKDDFILNTLEPLTKEKDDYLKDLQSVIDMAKTETEASDCLGDQFFQGEIAFNKVTEKLNKRKREGMLKAELEEVRNCATELRATISQLDDEMDQVEKDLQGQEVQLKALGLKHARTMLPDEQDELVGRFGRLPGRQDAKIRASDLISSNKWKDKEASFKSDVLSNPSSTRSSMESRRTSAVPLSKRPSIAVTEAGRRKSLAMGHRKSLMVPGEKSLNVPGAVASAGRSPSASRRQSRAEPKQRLRKSIVMGRRATEVAQHVTDLLKTSDRSLSRPRSARTSQVDAPPLVTLSTDTQRAQSVFAGRRNAETQVVRGECETMLSTQRAKRRAAIAKKERQEAEELHSETVRKIVKLHSILYSRHDKEEVETVLEEVGVSPGIIIEAQKTIEKADAVLKKEMKDLNQTLESVDKEVNKITSQMQQMCSLRPPQETMAGTEDVGDFQAALGADEDFKKTEEDQASDSSAGTASTSMTVSSMRSSIKSRPGSLSDSDESPVPERFETVSRNRAQSVRVPGSAMDPRRYSLRAPATLASLGKDRDRRQSLAEDRRRRSTLMPGSASSSRGPRRSKDEAAGSPRSSPRPSLLYASDPSALRGKGRDEPEHRLSLTVPEPKNPRSKKRFSTHDGNIMMKRSSASSNSSTPEKRHRLSVCTSSNDMIGDLQPQPLASKSPAPWLMNKSMDAFRKRGKFNSEPEKPSGEEEQVKLKGGRQYMGVFRAATTMKRPKSARDANKGNAQSRKRPMSGHAALKQDQDEVVGEDFIDSSDEEERAAANFNDEVREKAEQLLDFSRETDQERARRLRKERERNERRQKRIAAEKAAERKAEKQEKARVREEAIARALIEADAHPDPAQWSAEIESLLTVVPNWEEAPEMPTGPPSAAWERKGVLELFQSRGVFHVFTQPKNPDQLKPIKQKAGAKKLLGHLATRLDTAQQTKRVLVEELLAAPPSQKAEGTENQPPRDSAGNNVRSKKAGSLSQVRKRLSKTGHRLSNGRRLDDGSDAIGELSVAGDDAFGHREHRSSSGRHSDIVSLAVSGHRQSGESSVAIKGHRGSGGRGHRGSGVRFSRETSDSIPAAGQVQRQFSDAHLEDASDTVGELLSDVNGRRRWSSGEMEVSSDPVRVAGRVCKQSNCRQSEDASDMDGELLDDVTGPGESRARHMDNGADSIPVADKVRRRLIEGHSSESDDASDSGEESLDTTKGHRQPNARRTDAGQLLPVRRHKRSSGTGSDDFEEIKPRKSGVVWAEDLVENFLINPCSVAHAKPAKKRRVSFSKGEYWQNSGFSPSDSSDESSQESTEMLFRSKRDSKEGTATRDGVEVPPIRVVSAVDGLFVLLRHFIAGQEGLEANCFFRDCLNNRRENVAPGQSKERRRSSLVRRLMELQYGHIYKWAVESDEADSGEANQCNLELAPHAYGIGLEADGNAVKQITKQQEGESRAAVKKTAQSGEEASLGLNGAIGHIIPARSDRAGADFRGKPHHGIAPRIRQLLGAHLPHKDRLVLPVTRMQLHRRSNEFTHLLANNLSAFWSEESPMLDRGDCDMADLEILDQFETHQKEAHASTSTLKGGDSGSTAYASQEIADTSLSTFEQDASSSLVTLPSCHFSSEDLAQSHTASGVPRVLAALDALASSSRAPPAGIAGGSHSSGPQANQARRVGTPMGAPLAPLLPSAAPEDSPGSPEPQSLQLAAEGQRLVRAEALRMPSVEAQCMQPVETQHTQSAEAPRSMQQAEATCMHSAETQRIPSAEGQSTASPEGQRMELQESSQPRPESLRASGASSVPPGTTGTPDLIACLRLLPALPHPARRRETPQDAALPATRGSRTSPSGPRASPFSPPPSLSPSSPEPRRPQSMLGVARKQSLHNIGETPTRCSGVVTSRNDEKSPERLLEFMLGSSRQACQSDAARDGVEATSPGPADTPLHVEAPSRLDAPSRGEAPSRGGALSRADGASRSGNISRTGGVHGGTTSRSGATPSRFDMWDGSNKSTWQQTSNALTTMSAPEKIEPPTLSLQDQEPPKFVKSLKGDIENVASLFRSKRTITGNQDDQGDCWPQGGKAEDKPSRNSLEPTADTPRHLEMPRRSNLAFMPIEQALDGPSANPGPENEANNNVKPSCDFNKELSDESDQEGEHENDIVNGYDEQEEEHSNKQVDLAAERPSEFRRQNSNTSNSGSKDVSGREPVKSISPYESDWKYSSLLSWLDTLDNAEAPSSPPPTSEHAARKRPAASGSPTRASPTRNAKRGGSPSDAWNSLMIAGKAGRGQSPARVGTSLGVVREDVSARAHRAGTSLGLTSTSPQNDLHAENAGTALSGTPKSRVTREVRAGTSCGMSSTLPRGSDAKRAGTSLGLADPFMQGDLVVAGGTSSKPRAGTSCGMASMTPRSTHADREDTPLGPTNSPEAGAIRARTSCGMSNVLPRSSDAKRAGTSLGLASPCVTSELGAVGGAQSKPRAGTSCGMASMTLQSTHGDREDTPLGPTNSPEAGAIRARTSCGMSNVLPRSSDAKRAGTSLGLASPCVRGDLSAVGATPSKPRAGTSCGMASMSPSPRSLDAKREGTALGPTNSSEARGSRGCEPTVANPPSSKTRAGTSCGRASTLPQSTDAARARSSLGLADSLATRETTVAAAVSDNPRAGTSCGMANMSLHSAMANHTGTSLGLADSPAGHEVFTATPPSKKRAGTFCGAPSTSPQSTSPWKTTRHTLPQVSKGKTQSPAKMEKSETKLTMRASSSRHQQRTPWPSV